MIEFIAERTTLKKEEINSKHTDDMLMQDLKAQIEQDTANRDGSEVKCPDHRKVHNAVPMINITVSGCPDHRKVGCEGRIDVDQAALTGESLPATLCKDDKTLMGLAVMRGKTEGTGVRRGLHII